MSGMNQNLREAVEKSLGNVLDKETKIAGTRAVGGGCINSTLEITTPSGSRYFLKVNPKAPKGFFERETEGLLAIRDTKTIRAPEPLAVGNLSADNLSSTSFLIMEYIDAASPRPDFSETFGRQLAALHRCVSNRFGFGSDNFIGALPQRNDWGESWTDFFGRLRLGVQLEMLERRGYATSELRGKFEKLLGKMERLIGTHALLPSLLHGDLWSGNVMADESGAPVLIDPAVYYGDREADLALTELFGRFDAPFYAAYAEAFPLEPGYDERRDIYNLYHLLNHLNLFGLSYMGGVMEILRRYA